MINGPSARASPRWSPDSHLSILHVLVHETAKSVSSCRPDGCTGTWESAAYGWVLTQRSVRPVCVVMVDVLPQDQREVAWSGDQEMVKAFAA